MDTSKFQSELSLNERIVWTGQPAGSALFTKADIFLVPFSIFWFGFVLFWVSNVFFIGSKEQPIDLVFLAFGTFFFFIGFYFAIGRFIYKKLKNKNTYYAVTNKRIIILVELFGKEIITSDIATLPSVTKSVNSKGRGTIILGNINPQTGIYANTGMDLMGWGGQAVPAFYDIDNVEEVYKKINNIKDSKN